MNTLSANETLTTKSWDSWTIFNAYNNMSAISANMKLN